MQRFVYKCIVFNGGCSDVEGIMVVVLVVGFMVFKVFGVYCQFENLSWVLFLGYDFFLFFNLSIIIKKLCILG